MKKLLASLGAPLVGGCFCAGGQVKMTESRFKNFFNYGNDGSKEKPEPKRESKEPRSGYGDDYDRVWEAKVSYKTTAFGQCALRLKRIDAPSPQAPSRL